MSLILALLLAGQTTPTKLPPANPLPYSDPDVAGVMAPVDGIVAALRGGDAAGVLARVRVEGGVTTAGAKGVTRSSWAEFAETYRTKAGGPKVEQHFGPPAVEIDGDVAMVWMTYAVRVDGKPYACGADHFDLVREGGAWKVLNLSWSQRTEGCIYS